MAAKNKLIRYVATEVSDVFDKEDELIAQVQSNQLSQVLLLWQVKSPTLVLPAGRKWPVSEELKTLWTTPAGSYFLVKLVVLQFLKFRESSTYLTSITGQKINPTT